MHTRERVLVIVTALILMLGGLTALALTVDQEAPAANEPESDKVFICKYVGTPGVDERLQTGQNPISVSINSIPAGVPIVVGSIFADEQGRSVILAFDTGQPDPSPDDCPQPPTPTTEPPDTTGPPDTEPPTTGPPTSPPTPGLFLVNVGSVCVDGQAFITITMGNRPDLEGQVGTLTITPPGTALPLTFLSNQTQQVPYPAGADEADVNMTYLLAGETESGQATFPGPCGTNGTTTTTTTGATTTTTFPGTTTTTTPPTTVPPVPGVFQFGAAATVCVAEVPTIRIVFQNTFPELAGQTGTLTMSDVNGNVVSTQALVYQPNTTVNLLYPGTQVNADGSIADVPGWTLTSAGLWIRDPSDEFLREGINLTYTVNPTATAFVTYPPESSTCANPPVPPPPGGTTTTTRPPSGTQPEPFCVANPGAEGCTDDGFPIVETG